MTAPEIRDFKIPIPFLPPLQLRTWPAPGDTGGSEAVCRRCSIHQLAAIAGRPDEPNLHTLQRSGKESQGLRFERRFRIS